MDFSKLHPENLIFAEVHGIHMGRVATVCTMLSAEGWDVVSVVQLGADEQRGGIVKGLQERARLIPTFSVVLCRPRGLGDLPRLPEGLSSLSVGM